MNIHSFTGIVFKSGKFWFGFVAFSYGIIAVTRCARYDVNLVHRPDEATLHVLVWTFGPPLWFAFETYVLTEADGRADLEKGQKMMSSLWAAVLAAILFLIKVS
jgi:hypothetical protein